MTPARRPTIDDADPFDLPAWVGEQEVVWYADEVGGRDDHRVTGRLTCAGQDDLVCDLIAIDQAYPVEVADSGWRRRAHQAWRHGQVLLVTYDGRTTLAVPGHAFDADLVLVALARFAKAVGSRPERYVAAIRLGAIGRGDR